MVDVFDLDYEARKEFQLLVLIDFLTYIPFGDAGYKFLNGKFEEMGTNIVSFRFARLQKMMGKSFIELSIPEKDRIYEFFDSYEKNEINPHDPLDLAILVLRMAHKMEANYGYNQFSDIIELGTEMGSIFDRLGLNEFKNPRDDYSINECLKMIPDLAPFGDKQKEKILGVYKFN